MRKLTYLILMIGAILLVGCKTKIKITVDESITVYTNEPFQLNFETNDKKGLLFESLNETMFTIDENGVIIGHEKGQSFLKIVSKSDKNVTMTITVRIEQGETITVPSELTLMVGESSLLNVVKSFDTGVNFSSADTNIVTVDANGNITAVGGGTVDVTVTSKENERIKGVVTVTVTEGTTITVDESVTLSRESTLQLNVETNIHLGVSYVSSNENIVTVSNEGKLTGINKGTAVVKVVSKVNATNYKEVEVTVTQLEGLVTEVHLDAGDQHQVPDLVANASYESADENIATVSDSGLVIAVSPGQVVITITNKNDESITEEYIVNVVTEPVDFTIVGSEKMLLGQTQQLSLTLNPVYADPTAFYQSLNPMVASVDLNTGLVTAVGPGSAGIKITSLSNQELTRVIYITVSSIMAVDSTKGEGDSITYLDFTLEYGVNLFNNIDEAIAESVNNTEILVYPGSYNSPVVIDRGINLRAQGEVTLNTSVVIASSNVTIDGFTIKGGTVSNTSNTDNVKVINNKFTEINASTIIKLEGVSNAHVNYNEIIGNINQAIVITGLKKGSNYIKGNIIDGGNLGIKISSTENFDAATIIDVMWNEISNIEVGLDINLGQGNNVADIRKVLRFNKLSGYETALITVENHGLDLNLNYWGETIDINKFENVNNSELAAFYANSEDVLTEEDYNPRVPVKIEITNKIDEIEVGVEYTIEYVIYPRELSDNTVSWRYSNTPVIEANGATIKGLESWDVLITLRARDNANVYDSFMLSITTDPYLEFVPVNRTYSDFYVGNTFQLNVNVVPYQIRDEKVIYETSDENIATISETGLVSLVGAGPVTIDVYLEMDNTLRQEFKFVVFDELDMNDPFDYAISTMVNYSIFRSWKVYGVNLDYKVEYLDSVSKLLIGDIEIDLSMMIPGECPQIRPGSAAPRLKPNLPDEQIYNPEYVQYVVVHETANTDVGGGALWHANYLMNGYLNGTDRYASWHYTVDDKKIYQHIPLEEVAYHAGDGSTVAGSPWRDGNQGGIGGGNRNGIGIETSVAHGDNIMSIWHRTARLSAKLSKQFNLPANDHMGNVKFHQDFSGKVCPQSMINAGLTGYFYDLVEKEYYREYNFPGLMLSINSHNTEYLTNDGRLNKVPYKAVTVSYDLTITYNGESRTHTLYVYIPGLIK